MFLKVSLASTILLVIAHAAHAGTPNLWKLIFRQNERGLPNQEIDCSGSTCDGKIEIYNDGKKTSLGVYAFRDEYTFYIFFKDPTNSISYQWNENKPYVVSLGLTGRGSYSLPLIDSRHLKERGIVDDLVHRRIPPVAQINMSIEVLKEHLDR